MGPHASIYLSTYCIVFQKVSLTETCIHHAVCGHPARTFVNHTEEAISQPRSNILLVLRLVADLELAGARDVVSMAVSVEPV